MLSSIHRTCSHTNYGSPLEEAVGCLRFPRYPTICDIRHDDITLTQAMDNPDAFRLFLFRELTDKADYRVADLSRTA